MRCINLSQIGNSVFVSLSCQRFFLASSLHFNIINFNFESSECFACFQCSIYWHLPHRFLSWTGRPSPPRCRVRHRPRGPLGLMEGVWSCGTWRGTGAQTEVWEPSQHERFPPGRALGGFYLMQESELYGNKFLGFSSRAAH